MKKEPTRREFLSTAKNMALGLGVIGIAPGMFLLKDARAAIPVSGGYLLVDTKKCQGCLSCMLACSLVNEGEENLSFHHPSPSLVIGEHGWVPGCQTLSGLSHLRFGWCRFVIRLYGNRSD